MHLKKGRSHQTKRDAVTVRKLSVKWCNNPSNNFFIMALKKKKERKVEIYIKRGSHIFILKGCPISETKAAKIMLKLIDFHTEKFGIRTVRKRR